MLNKSNMHPAYASVGLNGSTNNNANINNSNVFFSTAEDDDFNAFGDTSAKPVTQTQKPKRQQKQEKPQQTRAPKRKKRSRLNPKAFLIGAVAIVAIVLVIVLMVALFSSPGKNIRHEDNVFFTYTDADGNYRVVSNGKLIKETFEGEVELLPAKDNSFAYIFEELVNENGESIIQMYILDGKKLSLVDAEATSIVACAEYEPGIIFKNGTSVQLFTNSVFEDISSNASASDFLISGDASTVVFTEKSGRDNDIIQMIYFRDGGFNDIGETAGIIPSAVSRDGKYVYAHDASNAFYCLEVTKRGTECTQTPIVPATSKTFGGVSELNANGNEVIFSYAEVDGRVASYIYKVGDDKPTGIAEGIFKYAAADSEVTCPATFIDSYFTAERTVTDENGRTSTVTSTYLYTRKGARKLVDARGQFSDDGKYFYYIDSSNSDLVRISLRSKNFEEDAKVISKAIDSFAITEKGDLYTYSKATSSSSGTIYFKKFSDSTTKKISSRPDQTSMSACGNSVYFSETVNDEVKIYISTGGATKEEVTFKKVTPASNITIEMGTGDKGYAYFVDAEGNTKLLYTRNGKDFDIICDSCFIPGYNADVNAPTEE